MDEGFGTIDTKVPNNPGNVHQSMIKRFNQHSIMVLKASKKKATEPVASDSKSNQSSSMDNHAQVKKQRIQEKISYEDLDTSIDKNANNKTHLNLSKVNRYLK